MQGLILAKTHGGKKLPVCIVCEHDMQTRCEWKHCNKSSPESDRKTNNSQGLGVVPPQKAGPEVGLRSETEGSSGESFSV